MGKQRARNEQNLRHNTDKVVSQGSSTTKRGKNMHKNQNVYSVTKCAQTRFRYVYSWTCDCVVVDRKWSS